MTDAIMSAERILGALREAGVPQAVIASKLALPQSAVSNLFNGKRHLKLSEANTLLSLLPRRPQGREVPVIGMAGAGRWLEAIEEATDRLYLTPGLNVEGRFAVKVVGDSMNMLLPDGSHAVVDPEDRGLYNARLYLLRNADGDATIKRYRADPARFEPVSDNPDYEPFEVGSSDFQVIGRITAGVQRF